MPEPEWNSWMDDANITADRKHLMIYFDNARRVFPDLSDQVTRFTPGDEVSPSVTSIFIPGHTSFPLDAGGDDQMLVWGNVTNHTDFMLRHPYWIPTSNIIPDLGLETRLRMLETATADNLRVSAFHGPFTGVGNIRQMAEREYRLVPRQWTEDMDNWL